MTTTPTSKVSVEIKAHRTQIPILRGVVAHLASINDYTIEEIDDLKMLVEEATTVIANAAQEDAALKAEVEVDENNVIFRVKADAVLEVDEESFAWTIVEALSDKSEFRDGVLEVQKTSRVEEK